MTLLPVDRNKKLVASAVRRLELLARQEAFDPYNLESRPTPAQSSVIQEFGKIKQQWIRAGNQTGKSATCARNISWALTDTHPYWKRPDHWLGEPLLVIIAARSGKQIEESLLPKLTGYLEPGSYKEIRIGNMIQRLEMTNGNRVVFQSLENPTVARERLQSYTAHIAWVDELPPTMDIVRELLIRVQARDGYFMASFTPTVFNIEIQRYVNSIVEPQGKVYRFHMLDNPLYADTQRKTELLARYAHLPEHVRKVIYEGEWISGEGMVYFFNYSTMVADTPAKYSPTWRHVESVDPAMKSALGLTIWAEDPESNIWYCIHAEYIRNILTPADMVNAVRERTRRYNITRHISDPHESWYINTAAAMGIHYMGVNKNGRKHDLIKQLQQFLGGRIRLSPTCSDLIQELQECRWADSGAGSNTDRIVNSSSYHLLDSSQYFCDAIPQPEAKPPRIDNYDAWLYTENEKRQIARETQRHGLEKKQQREIARRQRIRQGGVRGQFRWN